MKAGDRVALAKPGTKLPPSPKFPEGITIQATKIRGEVSEGMLCSEDELGFMEEIQEGIIILPEWVKMGDKLINALRLDEVVFDIGITPNRPDCLSVIGIAREVAAITGSKLRYPDFSVIEDGEEIVKLASVEVLDPGRCPRYSCRVITDVKIAPSPEWLQKILETSGIRAINNIVDVTNYVLLELGQPLHAFDYELLDGRKIIVRTAEKDEVIETLDGIKRTLTEEDLLICDALKPVAIGGVMGGANTEVSEKTKSILLESAYFDPVSIRRTSKRTGLKSESSYRFERGVDPNGVVRALDRASELIRELTGGKVARGRIDVYPNPIIQKEIKISVKKTEAILGTEVGVDRIKWILEGLELETVGAKDKDKDNEIVFRVPTFRVDLLREIDLIEEIVRHYGYRNIPETLPRIPMKGEAVSKKNIFEERVRSTLISLGFLEVINYSFEDPEVLGIYERTKPINILNPLTREGSSMRTTLIPGILRNVNLNLTHQAQDIRVFEIGRAYLPKENAGLPDEVTRVTGAMTGKREKELWSKEEVDFFDLKGVVERIFDAFSLSAQVSFGDALQNGFLHPGRSVRALIKGEEVGILGELHPSLQDRLEIPTRVCLFELDLGKLSFFGKMDKEFSPLPRFPSVRRDIAVVLDESISSSRIVREIEDIKSPFIEEIEIFDVFRGGQVPLGRKSVAVSITLRANDRTLTDEEINGVQDKIIKRFEKSLGAQLRGR